MKMGRTQKTIEVPFGSCETVRIGEAGYYWLQAAMPESHWWLTAVYNGQKELVQYYFDITLENHMKGHGKSWFWDLYLDVVMMPDGRMELLDEEDISNALLAKEISQKQYDNAFVWAEELIEGLSEHQPELDRFCRELLQTMLPRLHENKQA